MSEEFDEIVQQLTILIRACCPNGGIVFPEIDLRENILALSLGVYWFKESQMFPQGAYVCGEEAGNQLLKLTWLKQDLGAWKLAKKVASHRLALGEELPSGLRTFAALYLSEQISQPTTPKRNKTWLRQNFIYLLINLARYRAELDKVRGENKSSAKPDESACDAAVAALANCGYHISYRAAREICTSNKPNETRIRAEHLEWTNAVAATKKRDPIAAMAMPGLSAQYWQQTWTAMAEEN